MWSFLVGILPFASTAFQYYIGGKATKSDLEKRWADMTIGMSKRNRSADERMDVIEQEERLNELKNKKEEISNGPTKE